jgi:hypothetical protein
MSQATQAFADAVSATFTDERYPLGSTRFQNTEEVSQHRSGVDLDVVPTLTVGERTWIFIQAVTAVTAGDLCGRNAIGTPYNAIPDASNEGNKVLFPGVADHDIAALSYGWVVAKGVCVVQTKTGVTAADLLSSDGNVTAGEVDTWTSGAGTSKTIIGEALETEAAGAEYGAGFVQARIDLL